MIKEKVGFTLTELMAVVIIVSILAVLGAGYYRKSVEQSRFTEILANTNAVAESLNRYIMEKQAEGLALENIPAPNFTDLDISFASCGKSNVCDIKGRYRITLNPFQFMVGGRPTQGLFSGGNAYTISVNSHFVAPKDRVACSFGSGNQEAHSFCESMGFTQCEEGNPVMCTQPIR